MSADRAGAATVRGGVAYAAAAYLFWGMFPLYFRTLAAVPPPEILANRIGWSLAFLVVLVTARRRWREVTRQLASRRTLLRLAASATLISTNWLIYIWAVNSEHVLDASLGYFITPLVNILLGVVFLHESFSRRQLVAVALAGAGVGMLAVRVHHVPWVALALAATFGLYGLVRKRVPVDAEAGLLAEVGLLGPLAIAYVAILSAAGEAHFGGTGRNLLLASTGIATAVPLLWFANGVRRLRLSTIGLLQYLNPTVQFAIGVFVFGEPFGATQAVAFGCIWASVAVYMSEALALSRRAGIASGAVRG